MAAIQVKYTQVTIALSAAVAKTVLQVVAPANQRLRVKSIAVYFDGASPTATPIKVRVLRQTTAGTGTALAGVLVEKELTETIQSSGFYNFSFEPTPGDVLEQKQIHPQSGYEKIYPYADEIIVQGGGRLAIECTAPATVNVTPEITLEE